MYSSLLYMWYIHVLHTCSMYVYACIHSYTHTCTLMWKHVQHSCIENVTATCNSKHRELIPALLFVECGQWYNGTTEYVRMFTVHTSAPMWKQFGHVQHSRKKMIERKWSKNSKACAKTKNEKVSKIYYSRRENGIEKK